MKSLLYLAMLLLLSCCSSTDAPKECDFLKAMEFNESYVDKKGNVKTADCIANKGLICNLHSISDSMTFVFPNSVHK